MKEEWRSVIDGDYEASNLGRIRRARPGRSTYVGKLLKPHPLPRGYWQVGVCIDGRGRQMYVHRLVAEAFHGRCPPGREVNHIDGNKSNNCASNLEYLTRLENVRHAIASGLSPQCVPKPKPPKIRKPRTIHRGADHWTKIHPQDIPRGSARYNCKLSEAKVREMRSMWAAGVQQRTIAAEYGLSYAQTSRVINGTRWGYVK